MTIPLRHIRKPAIDIICYLFVLLFVYAAVSKLLDFNTFQNQLGQSPLLSAYADWVVWVVPLSEILIAIALVVPRWRRWGAYTFLGMMVMFTTYIIIILNFTDFIPCSCGGVLEELGWTEHLLFNLFFILLGGVLVVLLEKSLERRVTCKKLILWISGVFITGIVTVSILFISSEKTVERNNSFIRLYPPHPITKTQVLDLGLNSYYLAGLSKDQVYLGNTTAPLNLRAVDTSLQNVKKNRVAIDQLDLDYRSVKLYVRPPYFYVTDGTVPIIFRGAIADWYAETFFQNQAYFSQFVVADTSNFLFRTIKSDTKENTLGRLFKTSNTDSLVLSGRLLEKQLDGIFDTDGLLLWNEQLQKMIYVYFYRNQFIVADKELNLAYRGNTIDTVTTAQIEVAKYTSQNQTKVDRNSTLVNTYSTTYGKYLFIQSGRLGKNEPDDLLDEASIIDVYNLVENTYAFSFYLFHHQGKQLKSFSVEGDRLVALMDNYLVTYRIAPRYVKQMEVE